MARKLLKTNDSAWLFAESYRTPMQVGMLATFRVPEDRPGFVADLVARWRGVQRFEAPYNFLFKKVPVPSWVEVPDGPGLGVEVNDLPVTSARATGMSFPRERRAGPTTMDTSARATVASGSGSPSPGPISTPS